MAVCACALAAAAVPGGEGVRSGPPDPKLRGTSGSPLAGTLAAWWSKRGRLWVWVSRGRAALRHPGTAGSWWSAPKVSGCRTRPGYCSYRLRLSGNPVLPSSARFSGRRCFWLRGTDSRGGVPALLLAPAGNAPARTLTFRGGRWPLSAPGSTGTS